MRRGQAEGPLWVPVHAIWLEPFDVLVIFKLLARSVHFVNIVHDVITVGAKRYPLNDVSHCEWIVDPMRIPLMYPVLCPTPACHKLQSITVNPYSVTTIDIFQGGGHAAKQGVANMFDSFYSTSEKVYYRLSI